MSDAYEKHRKAERDAMLAELEKAQREQADAARQREIDRQRIENENRERNKQT